MSLGKNSLEKGSFLFYLRGDGIMKLDNFSLNSQGTWKKIKTKSLMNSWVG